MEENLAHQLVGIVYEPLFQVFIDVWKAYDFLYIWRYMELLRGYGLESNLHWLLQRFLDGQKVVPKDAMYIGWLFRTGRVVTQGYPFYPTIFNILVEVVVRAVMLEVCGT